MLKGHTTIELKDEISGEVKKYEDDNLVTNGFGMFFKRFGQAQVAAANTSYNLTVSTPFARSLFGGIMAFNGTIEEKVDNIAIPPNVDCTAYGSDVTTLTSNTKCGLYNTSESGLQDDGSYKHVWDFGTSHGNGIIASVCLVPICAGRLGWSTKALEYNSGIADNNVFNLGNIIDLNDYTATVDSILFFDDKYFYGIDRYNTNYNSTYVSRHLTRTGTLRINKYFYTNKEVGILDTYAYSKLCETIEITIPDEFKEQYSGTGTEYSYSYFVNYVDGCIYLYFANQTNPYVISSGSEFMILKIDVTDWTTEIIKLANNTGDDIYVGLASVQYNIYRPRVVKGDRLFAITAGRKHAIINLNDSTDVKIVVDEEGNEMTSSSRYIGAFFDDYILIKTVSDALNNYIVNLTTGIAFNITTRNYSNYFLNISNTYASYVNDDYYKIGFYINNSNQNVISFTMIPYILMTINNLDTPVTKTASQSMKITYTLQETAE